MTVPVLTFFNNKSGVGKTSLVYHLAWMLSDIGYRVLACDLDPQANLTAAFLDEEQLEKLWDEDNEASAKTTLQCVRPVTKVGDIKDPTLAEITSRLCLIPGDLALAGFEDTLSSAWPNALGAGKLYRPFRILTAFSTIMQSGAAQMNASVILADVGPNFGAINRSALIATDYIIVPLGADLFSLQSLCNLGPTLNQWRRDWQRRRDHWAQPSFPLPVGGMKPVGYVVQQHGVRLSRPIRVYDKWVNRMPEEYARNLRGDNKGPYPATPAQDEEHALATVKHYRSLVPMAQEARKPIFHLTTADGAIGSHAAAAQDARRDFRDLANKIIQRIDLGDV
jgi:cellulose biosynthesis protein BcsQ